MTLVILDPGLFMLQGHHFELDTALVDAAAALGVAGHVFCHHTDNPYVLAHPQITPAFAVFGDGTTDDPMLQDLDRFLLRNERVHADLRRIEEMIDMEETTLLFPTADFNSLTGIGRWVRGWRVRPRHLYILFPAHFEFALAGGVGRLDQLFYRYGFAQFSREAGEPVTFLTLSPRQAREYAAISGLRVVPAPYPVGEGGGSPPPPPGLADGRRLRVSVLGSSRNSKGFDLLPEIIRRVRAARPEVEFVVQYCPSEGALGSLPAVTAAGAEVIEGYLDRSSYHALLRSSDILLLPYLGIGYRVGTSAVFAEARWFGRPVVVTSGTSMADEIAADPRLGVVADPEPSALASAIQRLADAFPAAAAAAGDAASGYRRENGTSRLAEHLLRRP